MGEKIFFFNAMARDLRTGREKVRDAMEGQTPKPDKKKKREGLEITKQQERKRFPTFGISPEIPSEIPSADVESYENDPYEKAIAYLDFLLQFLPHANLPEKYNINVLKLLELKQILNKRLQTPDTETQAE